MKLLKPFVLSSIVTVAVLYLTLVPQPLPPPDVEIPFADKLVHGLMFAVIAINYAVDWSRHSHRRFVSIKESLWISLISILFGGVVEFLQWAMNVGRSGDGFHCRRNWRSDCVVGIFPDAFYSMSKRGLRVT